MSDVGGSAGSVGVGVGTMAVMSECFQIRKYNHKDYEPPIEVGSVIVGIRAESELARMKEVVPLSDKEQADGWCYELQRVDCPKRKRVTLGPQKINSSKNPK